MFVFDVFEEQETTKVLWGENHSNFEQSWSLCIPRLQGTQQPGHWQKKKLGSANRREWLKFRNIQVDVVRFRHVLDVWVKGEKQAKDDAKITALSEESHGYILCSF